VLVARLAPGGGSAPPLPDDLRVLLRYMRGVCADAQKLDDRERLSFALIGQQMIAHLFALELAVYEAERALAEAA
jgi:hypothetical protein